MNKEVLVKDMIRTMPLPKPRFEVPIAIVLIGAPATGKTTLAKELVGKFPLAYLSNEQVESYLTPHLNFFDENRSSMDFSFSTITELIRQKVSVVYDFSVDKIADRRQIKTDIEALGGQVLFVYLTCDDSAIFHRIQSANIRVVGGAKRGFILDQDYYLFKKNQIQAPLSEGVFEYDCNDDLAITRLSAIIESRLKIH